MILAYKLVALFKYFYMNHSYFENFIQKEITTVSVIRQSLSHQLYLYINIFYLPGKYSLRKQRTRIEIEAQEEGCSGDEFIPGKLFMLNHV